MANNMFVMGDMLVIKHKLMGNSQEAANLGPMSMELALWLEYKLTEADMREQEDSDGLAGIQYFLNRDPVLADVVIRSQLAGMRGYDPKLVEQYDYLTHLGLEKAKRARIVIKEINETLDNIVYSPNDWHNSDEMFITAGIHKRAIMMLRVMKSAIHEARRRYEDGTDAPPPVKVNDETKETTRSLPPEQNEFPTIDSIADLRHVVKKTELPTNFETIIFYGELTDEESRCWVPTAAFGQRARYDLNILVKYGLVDLKSYNLGNKGRPKHIVRPSRIGHTVLKDLERLRLL